MSKYIEVKLDENLLKRIDASNLSESERQVAISALRDAELVVDAFVWVARKIEQLGSHLFLKPGLKH